jgi:hypothetical protein
MSLADDPKLSDRPVHVEDDKELSNTKLQRKSDYTDEEVKDILKGKAVPERKRFLIELE